MLIISKGFQMTIVGKHQIITIECNIKNSFIRRTLKMEFDKFKYEDLYYNI